MKTKWRKFKKKYNFFQIVQWVTITVLLVLVLFLCWYIFDNDRGQEKQEKLELQEIQDIFEEVEKGDEFLDLSNNDPGIGGVVEKVSKHILLPNREFQVATVKDAAALNQENPILYQYVQNGHKMLIYSTGVIVYDPVLDKIVDVIQFYPERIKLIESDS